MTGNQQKYLSYKEAWKRIDSAIDQEFYLEAVTLCESIISDRLLSYIRGVDANCKMKLETPFAHLIQKWRALTGRLPAFDCKNDIGAALDDWRQDRNITVHGLVKSMPGTPTEDVQSFLSRAEYAAKKGKELARQISNWHKAELRRANK